MTQTSASGSFFIDQQVFADEAIDAATRAHNEMLIKAARAAPDRWSRSPQELRQDRRMGVGPFPLQAQSPRAETFFVEGDGHTVPVRVIVPETGAPTGCYLHLHGGGWMLGAADLQDERLAETAARTGMACLSVDYRLAPEHPNPAAADDCEAAALWLIGTAEKRFGTDRLVIGGESAGAHLSVVTLLRLRDKHRLNAFCGANLTCGIFDLAMTPSMRAFTEPLVLTRHDTEHFIDAFLQNGEDYAYPDISPIHADLTGLPPALFSCGTRDGLIDDTLFMAARWAAAGNHSDVALWPGGPHAFQGMDIPLAAASNRQIDAWTGERIARR